MYTFKLRSKKILSESTIKLKGSIPAIWEMEIEGGTLFQARSKS
jgi:hypothetical protein